MPLSLAELANRIAAIEGGMPDFLNVWNTSAQPARVITYQFVSAQPFDMSAQYSGWTPLTEAHKTAVRAALAQWAAVANISFVEDAAASDADITIGRGLLGAGVGGVGYYSYRYFTLGGVVTSQSLDGSVIYSSAVDLAAPNSMQLLLHEIGHALTLKHPGNYDVTGGSSPGPYLPTLEDNGRYTVMSYDYNPDTNAPSQSLQIYDIAAIQARFGANMSTATGDDTYTSTPGAPRAIWDAGGMDTFDGSARTNSVTIDLREGAFSTLATTNDLSIAYGAVIENAKGGSAADVITGNGVANQIAGGAGGDFIDGGAGSDVLYGQAGADTLNDGGHGGERDYLYGGSGNDTYYVTSSYTDANEDLVYEGGSNPDLMAGVGDIDTIISGGDFFWDFYSVGEVLNIAASAGSLLVGGKDVASKIITGGAGNDRIVTYGHNSIVDAGAGADGIDFGMYDLDASYNGSNTLVLKPGTGLDYVYNFESGVDHIDLTAFHFGITGQAVLNQAVNVDNAGAANDYCYIYLTGAGGTDNFITFMGLLSTQLRASDFIM